MDLSAGPRDLRFEKLADIHLELDRLEHAHLNNRLATVGSWTPGQLFGHLSYWVNGAYYGLPIKVPLIVRLLLRMRKKQAIFGKMPRGVHIGHVPGGTLGIEPMSFEEGMKRYREALERLRVQPPVHPSPALGELTHSEWIALTCRHAELHLGYLAVQDAAQKEEKPASV